MTQHWYGTRSIPGRSRSGRSCVTKAIVGWFEHLETRSEVAPSQHWRGQTFGCVRQRRLHELRCTEGLRRARDVMGVASKGCLTGNWRSINFRKSPSTSAGGAHMAFGIIRLLEPKGPWSYCLGAERWRRYREVTAPGHGRRVVSGAPRRTAAVEDTSVTDCQAVNCCGTTMWLLALRWAWWHWHACSRARTVLLRSQWPCSEKGEWAVESGRKVHPGARM